MLDKLMPALILMGQGMFGIFIVMIAIALVVYMSTKISKKKK